MALTRARHVLIFVCHAETLRAATHRSTAGALVATDHVRALMADADARGDVVDSALRCCHSGKRPPVNRGCYSGLQQRRHLRPVRAVRPHDDVEQLRSRVHVDVVAALREDVGPLQAEVARDHVGLAGDDQAQAIRVVERPSFGKESVWQWSSYRALTASRS